MKRCTKCERLLPIPDDVLLLMEVKRWLRMAGDAATAVCVPIRPDRVRALVSLVESERTINRVAKDQLRAERDRYRDLWLNTSRAVQ